MSVRKLRSAWWVDFRFDKIRYRKRSPLNTAEGARQYEVCLLRRLMRGEPVDGPVPTQIPTFAEFAAEWFETYVKTNNKPSEQHAKRCALRVHLIPAFGTEALSNIDAGAVEAFKRRKLADGLSPKTVNNLLAILRKALGCAEEWGRVERVPRVKPLRVEPPDTPFLSDVDCGRLLAAPVSSTTHAMILTALRTGLRLGELCALRWRDVDLEHRQLTVARSVVRGVTSSPKSNRIRAVPMTNDLAAELGALPHRDPELVFVNAHLRQIGDCSATKMLHRACKVAGIEPVGWHRLRHTFATQCYTRGVALAGIKGWLGHSTIAMTERYAHFAAPAFADAIHVLEPDQPAASVGNRRATA